MFFHFNCKTQRQMFLLHGDSIQSSLNLGNTLLRIAREWKAAETWFLVRLFILQSSIISQILEFIYWMVTILVLITWPVKTENSEAPKPVLKVSFHISVPENLGLVWDDTVVRLHMSFVTLLLLFSFPKILLNNWGRCCGSLHEVLFKLITSEMHIGY